jgi:hypothetical protein
MAHTGAGNRSVTVRTISRRESEVVVRQRHNGIISKTRFLRMRFRLRLVPILYLVCYFTQYTPWRSARAMASFRALAAAVAVVLASSNHLLVCEAQAPSVPWSSTASPTNNEEILCYSEHKARMDCWAANFNVTSSDCTACLYYYSHTDECGGLDWTCASMILYDDG